MVVDKMKTIIQIILIITMVFGWGYYSFWKGQQSVEPEIITEYVIVYKEVEVVWVVREVPIELRQFDSWHELRVWQANNYIKDAKPDECVDSARELYYKAIVDGFEMSYETWGDGLREGHEICATWIGDEKYFLEPTNTISWLAGIKK